MATILKSDEINRLYREYFDIMDISDEQKEERIELAELLDDVFIYLFLYVDTAADLDDLDIDEVYEMGISKYKDVVAGYGIDLDKHPDMSAYIEKMTKNIVDTTVKDAKKNAKNANDVNNRNSKNTTNSDSDSSNRSDKMPTLSDKSSSQVSNARRENYQGRAIEVAQNEANSIFNIFEYDNAVAKGYTKKTWITEGDTKVRETHQEVDFVTVAIDEPFMVGNSQMMFPKDISLGADAKEIIGCRCSVYYE